MSYIKRILEDQISAFIKKDKPPYHCILLGGARQTGKSTLLKNLFPESKHLHINLIEDAAFCEDIDRTQTIEDLAFLLDSRFGFKIGTDRVLIFDEAQLSKRLGHYVRFFKEKWKTQRVIMTGSTLSNLFENQERPTGRVVEFVLRPFNFLEFLSAIKQEALVDEIKNWSPKKILSETVHNEAIHHLQDYLKIGGLPAVVLAQAENGDPQRLLANIFAFYKRDFEEKLSSENLTGIFNQVFLRIAAAAGSSIKISSIIASSSPGYRKLRDVLSILELWHQIIRVDFETQQFTKSGEVTPKRYIFDHGIRFFQNPSRFESVDLLDSSFPLREDLGGVVENFVLTELVSLGCPLPIRSWEKTNQSGMVDFVLTEGKQTFAVEVKASTRFDRKYLSALLAHHEVYGQSKLILTNLNRGGVHFTADKVQVVNVPVYALFGYLKSLFDA